MESGAQELKVRSNKNFTVAVKTSAANFNIVTGSTSTASTMPVENILNLQVSANSTSGTIASGFAAYTSLSATSKDLITNASKGGNQTFAVKYKATPGFNYPAATYTTDVIYTATQQ